MNNALLVLSICGMMLAPTIGTALASWKIKRDEHKAYIEMKKHWSYDVDVVEGKPELYKYKIVHSPQGKLDPSREPIIREIKDTNDELVHHLPYKAF